MTFVAVLYANHHPLVLVDSLVSRPTNATAGIPTPLLSTLDARQGLGYQPVGLGRKFWLLPDRSLFLYAGTVGSARKLFDHLSERLTPPLRYDSDMHQDAREFREICTNGDFSFIVITLTEGNFEFYPDGTVHQSDISTYGYVIAIGSGAKDGLDMLRRYPGGEPDSMNAMLGNALNAAARLTRDYKDDWGNGSKMSAASCGGYFEVVPPALYEKGYEHLFRNTAQIFLTSDSRGVRLSQFVVANQGDEETVIVVGNNLAILLEPWGFFIDGACLRQYTIRANQIDTITEAPFNGKLSFAHITFMVIYANGVPDCGLSEHAFRTHSLSVRGGNPIALVLEDDSPDLVDPATGMRIGAGRVQFEIMTEDKMSPLRQMRDRIHAHMRCPLCAAGVP